MMEQNNKEHQTGQEEGIGRTFNKGTAENEGGQKGSGNNDISSIDQQEGSMEHGETGGSGKLGPNKKEETEK